MSSISGTRQILAIGMITWYLGRIGIFGHDEIILPRKDRGNIIITPTNMIFLTRVKVTYNDIIDVKSFHWRPYYISYDKIHQK